MKILNARTHGILDYVVVVVLALAPLVLGFTGWQAAASYALAAAHLLMTLATDFPMGAKRLIPFRTHGLIELVVAVALIVLPWVLGDPARGPVHYFAVGLGVVLLIVRLVTDYETAPRAA